MPYKDNIPIPCGVNFKKVKGLSDKEREILENQQPRSLGHAKHTHGLSDDALQALVNYFKPEKI